MRGESLPRRDNVEGLFGPRSMMWQVARENFLLFGGQRALLLQLAHPLVAAGVADHSAFRRSPWSPYLRLYSTGDTMLSIAFGTPRQAQRAAARIRRVHDRVHGRTRGKAGPYPPRTPYTAHDPSLLRWVMATLYETSATLYGRWVEPLPAGAMDRYYREWCTIVQMLGAPPKALPATRRKFEAYYNHMVEDGQLGVGEETWRLARFILHPPGVPRPVAEAQKILTAGLLPPEVREIYGLPWSHGRQALFQAAEKTLRWTIPRLPPIVRYNPYAWIADWRVRLLS